MDNRKEGMETTELCWQKLPSPGRRYLVWLQNGEMEVMIWNGSSWTKSAASFDMDNHLVYRYALIEMNYREDNKFD